MSHLVSWKDVFREVITRGITSDSRFRILKVGTFWEEVKLWPSKDCFVGFSGHHVFRIDLDGTPRETVGLLCWWERFLLGPDGDMYVQIRGSECRRMKDSEEGYWMYYSRPVVPSWPGLPVRKNQAINPTYVMSGVNYCGYEGSCFVGPWRIDKNYCFDLRNPRDPPGKLNLPDGYTVRSGLYYQKSVYLVLSKKEKYVLAVWP